MSARALGALVLLLVACGVEEPDDPPPPSTDLWLATLSVDGDAGTLRLGNPENLTHRRTYDNQPHFLADGRSIVYTAGKEDGGTDIHLLDLEERMSRALMVTTPEREYSPTPLEDGRIAVVRVEADGSTQRLWAFERAAAGSGDRAELLLPDLEPVGYHAWFDGDRVAAFVLGEPAALYMAEVGTGWSQLVFEGIGASIQKIPGEPAVSFVEITPDGGSWIRRLDGGTGATSRIVEGIDGGSDHAWMPDGTLLMASGSEIFAFRPGVDEGWESLGSVGPDGIVWSRMAVSPAGDRIVLVGRRDR